jgi:dienelactone hydrolase
MDASIPEGGGRHPTILILHGAEGVPGGASEYDRQLVRRGYVTLAPHYFESTGTSWADLDSIQRHAFTWGKTVVDAVDFATRMPSVDADRIGLLGFSLGGYLAIAVASQDTRVKGVVEFFGGLPEPLAASIERLPPTLILHGDADRVVPIRHAMRLKQLCQEKQVCFEMDIYSGAGHGFTGEVMQTSVERMARFFDQRLKELSMSR